MVIYVSIGNNDNKLSQQEWSEFVSRARMILQFHLASITIHGEWFSNPNSPYQNACWCIEVKRSDTARQIRSAFKKAREDFMQESIAWATAETEMI